MLLSENSCQLQAYFETCMKCFGGLSKFGGEINCLAHLHVANIDCVKSLEKVASVLNNAS